MSLFKAVLTTLSVSTIVSASAIPLVERQDNGSAAPAPAPAPTDAPAPAPDVDCAPNSSTGLKAECWKALDMDKYIKDWVAANGTAANCEELGFAQCYLQANGFTGLTCNLITSDTCPPFNTKSVEKYESNQQFYALWNIYTIYQFFNQYSQALSNGASLAGQTIDAIVAKVAPPVEANTPQSELFSVLTSTLGVVSTFTGLIPGNAGLGVGVIRGGLSAALDLAGKLGKPLKITQKANDRFVQLGDIGSGLAKFVETYQQNLLDSVKTIQGDQELFLAACSEGGFSQRVTTSLTIQASTLYRQLQLFILSSALKANGIISSRSTGLLAQDVARDTGEVTCDSLSAASSCFQWFVDEKAKNTYSFHNPNDWSNTHVDLMVAIIDNGWADLADVFEIENCAGKTPEFDPATLGITCLATHGYCEWDYSGKTPSTTVKQWTNCDNDSKWGTLCSSFAEGKLVPESYLGPLLSNSAFFCKKQ
ncbi:hypothetical protein NXS19_010794 [Fusarium pseudograminearum]|uniref:Uncharacterized protein n=1 Tax=Fusarium pseudograminearum (strain CS3096) TaxID=1028729 RepID=K3USH1_FUSPC|nr:hypothetical protein FPSE_04479 [Fusarium pseudograminearum CS3096]EKJ75351.1 hypothetical protein FPSE_04479 [Fusarium pseudograminearum CS3096]KAF0637897.1 hypothetical protein FPSE5266_04479 [Fusarium pseudograminearum]UZP42978.1 hypothetical protein NXS19_010794 [Fusarium pseudograminearum]